VRIVAERFNRGQPAFVVQIDEPQRQLPFLISASGTGDLNINVLLDGSELPTLLDCLKPLDA
jgi:hypothetical protein